ncbi:alpha/beta hydrolase [Staphylococcus sp. EZ-P03]|uniref:alpha/beta fold hydrolase n=1 Tax=Staphylococcus sp. EZ-P03 TaxID=2282739 RepID=UPI000DF7D370|nr:alpha/beta hydrolase [Staphylococcus sp. EZ-P03]
MNTKNRKWIFTIGSGNDILLVLPRKDGFEITIKEWELLHNLLYGAFKIIVLDLPEYLIQKNNYKHDITPKDMANTLFSVIDEIEISKIRGLIGVSLGGMIAQEFIRNYYYIPTIIISSISKNNEKTTSVFRTWKNLLKFSDINSFQIALKTWLTTDDIYLEKNILQSKKRSTNFSKRKELLCLNAITNHNLTDIKMNNIKPILVLYGEKSPLIGKEESFDFCEYFERVKIIGIRDSGMRILNDNPIEAYSYILKYIKKEC